MGIPSYFSYIVRNHRSIIKKYNPLLIHIDNLYLDCNSIIYDSVREIKGINKSHQFETCLIKMVCDKILYYIHLIKPKQRVFVAFDGVAPVAKLEQQRNRRYKSWFEKQIYDEVSSQTQLPTDNNSEFSWNTVAITPGTKFMEKLGNGVRLFFKNKSKFKLDKLIVSSSDEVGEGEHKIYEYIRKNNVYHKSTATAIYGLDADLIMLTLNHLHISDNMYLFRETPHFIRSIDKTLDPNSNYVMDIPELAKKLALDLRGKTQSTNQQEITEVEQKRLILDYILLCFFLGNDFMPHFPALNIRTDGIARLLMGYNTVLRSKRDYITDGKKIIWKNLRKLVNYLSENEQSYIKTEYQKRRKLKPRRYSEDEDTTLNKIMDVPIKDRTCEEYINPFECGWRERYYSQLFGIDIDEERCKEICKNYLEGLEWTINYYTSGCKDWRWTYKYEYPPLLCDLIKYIPYFDTEMLPTQIKNPVKDLVQLSYVLPRPYLDLLPKELKNKLLNTHVDWYIIDCKIEWAYCRYLWEAHAIMPEINIKDLELLINK